MKRSSLVWFGLVAALVGCTTIRSAREAQDEAEKRVNAARRALDEIEVAAEIPQHGFALSWYMGVPAETRPSMVSARLAVEDARLALKEIEADAPLLSTTPWNAADLSVSASYSESSAGTTFSENHWSTDGDPSGALSLDLLVYDFGRNAAAAKAQSERVLAAEEALVREGYTVLTEIANAYFSLCEKLALVEAARTNEVVYQLHLEQVEQLKDAGEAKDLDLIRARLDLAQAREAVVAASNNVLTTRADFFHAVGVEHPAFVSSTDLLERDLNLTELVQAFAPTTGDFDEAFRFASTNAPSIQIARARVRAASADVDRAIADLYPSVSASVALSWTDPLWYLRWGVSAAQSIFTGFRKTTAVDRARVALKTAEANLDQVENDVRRDLEVALAARDTAHEALRTARASLRTARENLVLVGTQYRLGEVNRVEFSDAVRAVSDALGNRASAFYRGQRAEATLVSILGATPRFDETIIKENE